MKIAQYTLNVYDNYGNMLQKYALHRVLKRYADQVDVLWSTQDLFLPEAWEWNWKPQLMQMMNSSSVRRKFIFEAIRQTKFKEFADRYIRTRFDICSLEDLADEYDYFVVGSDQVWNPEFLEWFFPERFLSFAAREKRIAYAASIALDRLPEHIKPVWKAGLLGMDFISVREKSAVPIVEELTGKAPPVLVDPIFLLTAEEWSEVALRPAWLNDQYDDGYILAYFLSEIPPVETKTLSKEFGLPVINLLDPTVFDHYNVGPSEFLYLVEHASLIYTSSFHGTAFSILMARPFVMCEFLPGVPHRLLRMYSLMEDFDLMSRKVGSDRNFRLDKPFEIDYSARDEVLRRERARAKNFLDEALKRIEHED